MLVSPMNRRSPSTDTVGGETAVEDLNDNPPDRRFTCARRNSLVATAGDVPDTLDCRAPASEPVGEARDGSLRGDNSADAAGGV